MSEKRFPVTFCKVFIGGKLGVTVVDACWFPLIAWVWVDSGFDKMILFPELDITGPGSDALGVRPDTMLLPAGILLASLLGILSAIIVVGIRYTEGYTCKLFDASFE